MHISTEDLRFQRLVRHLHGLGPRALGEFIVALASYKGGPVPFNIWWELEQFERIDARQLETIAGTLDFPATPIRPVP